MKEAQQHQNPTGQTRRQILRGLFGMSGAAGMPSCASPRHHAHLGSLYNAAAQRDEPGRNPVIVIPGILGSRLRHAPTDALVWGILGGGHAKRHLNHLALPMRPGVALRDLHDEVVPDGVLDRMMISVGTTLAVKAYAQLLATLGAGGYRDQSLGISGVVDYGPKHYTCFQFDYDWRRSCAENAASLGRFIEQKRRYVEAEHQKRFGRTGRVKFDLVAHSMGGLVARYYLRYGAAPLPADGSLPALTWAGARELEKVVLVGTPNGGSAQAVNQLVHGYRPGPIVGGFSAAVLGTMPAIYEMLPRDRRATVLGADGWPLDHLDAATWQRHQWGLANPVQDEFLQVMLPQVSAAGRRREIALDHQRKCLRNAVQFHAAMDRPTTLPHNISLSLFAGDSEPTLETMREDSDGRLHYFTKASGDGVVTRKSALLDQRHASDTGKVNTPISWTHTTFIAADHLGITRDPTFSDNVLHLLLER